MKLNNNGWTVITVIVILLFFVLCLIIAFLGIEKLGLLRKPMDLYYTEVVAEEPYVKNFSYFDLENTLESSTKKYFNDVYNNEIYKDTIIINASTLKKNGYLDNFVDDKNNSCSGYTEVFMNSINEIEYYAYIKCDNYKTEGYLERKDSNE